MGKSSINRPFSMAMLNNQRVNSLDFMNLLLFRLTYNSTVSPLQLQLLMFCWFRRLFDWCALAEAQQLLRQGDNTIFLLYGPPGCGKTLTAEAIAEMLHMPLYVPQTMFRRPNGPMLAETEMFENLLSGCEVLHLCSEWNALTLIDEAATWPTGVFMGFYG